MRAFIRSNILIAAIVTALVTILAIRHSAHAYRLSCDIDYDDCGYFCDALVRLDLLHSEGPGAFFSQLRAQPPHAPAQTALAMAAFTIFGRHDWAPYAMNGVPYFCFVLGALYVARSLPLPGRLAALVVACTVKFTTDAIAFFRPEFPSSVLLAIAVYLVAQTPLNPASRRRLVIAGLAWGGSMLAKPTFAPLTLCVFGLAALHAAIDAGLLSRRRARPRRSIIADLLIPFAAAAPLLCLYYPFALTRIVHYIHEAQFGPAAAQWRVHDSLSGHVLYYLTGPGGTPMLGDHLYLFAVLIGAAFVLARVQRQAETSRFFFRLLLPAFVAYAIVSANPHKQFCFGWGFQILLTYAAIAAMTYLTRELTRDPRPIARAGRALPIVAAIIGCLAFRMPGYGKYRRSGRIASDIFQTVLQPLETPGRPVRAFIPFGVPSINQGTFNWLAVRERSEARYDFRTTMTGEDLPLEMAECALADVVIVPHSPTGSNELPHSAATTALVESLDADPAFVRVRDYPRLDFVVRVYRRATAPGQAAH